MKRLLSTVLCLCMLLSILPADVSAATILTIYKVTIDEPQIGQPLPQKATLPSTASTYVTNVEWKGNLDENGNVKAGEKYTVYVTVRVKDTETNKFIVEQKGKPTVNGKGADLINVTKDNKQGVVCYTFPELLSGPLAGKEPITVFVQLERPVEGAELSYNCTPKESQVGMFDVLSVDWQGELDENGKIKNGCEYYARIKIRLTDLCYTKYYLNNSTPDRPYINGSVTGWESVSEDGREGVILKGWISKDKPEEKKEEAAAEEDGDAKYLRLMADFQNYKKRVEKEKKDLYSYANEKLATDLLEVVDNFERALSHEDSGDGFKEGMEMIFKQLNGVLEKHGLAEIPALGEDFDPNFHNAVMQVESEEYESGIVAQEFDPNFHNAVMTEETDEYESGKVSGVLQKGYTLNGKVIRPSMVKVVS